MPIAGRAASLPKYLNPVLTPVSGRLPPLALLHHRGRRSGAQRATPVQAFRTPEGFIVGLAYDRNAAWALNVLANGDGELTRAGKSYRLSNPRRSGPEGQRRLPRWAALMMRAISVEDFIEFDAHQTP